MYYPDISRYRPVTNWSKAKENAFIISKATQGQNYIDPTLFNFIDECEKNKIPYWLYSYLNKGDEKAQAGFLHSTCSPKVGEHFVGYILDVEENNDANSVKDALEWLSSVATKTMIYTGYSAYTKYKSVISGRPSNCAWWEARYGKDTGDYNSAYPCHAGVDLHQFTSKGKAPGITDKCDLSRLTGNKVESWFTTPIKEEKMSIRIGSARISEKGTISGTAGDQKQSKTPDYTGEVSLEKYYTHSLGWVCLRAKEASVANKLAYAMEAMCNNKNFGYSQSQRLTGYNAAAAVAFDPAKVKVACNIDCSEAIRVCLAYAGIKVADFNTATEVKTIYATGKFEKITSVKESALKVGDILVTKTKGHTAIVVSGTARETTTATKPTTTTPVTTPVQSQTSKSVKATEAARAYYAGYSRVMTTNQNCNIRNGAGTDKKSLGVLPKGTQVRCYGYYTPIAGRKWFYVVASANGISYTGYVSSVCLNV